MLVLLWTELETINAQIGHIQAARLAAKQKQDGRLAAALSAELDAASADRESLVARISANVVDTAIPAPIRRLIEAIAGSPYLNQKPRSLDDVLRGRESRKPVAAAT